MQESIARAEQALAEQEEEAQLRLQEREHLLDVQQRDAKRDAALLKQREEQLEADKAALEAQTAYVADLTQKVGPLDLLANKQSELERVEALITEREAEVGPTLVHHQWHTPQRCADDVLHW